MSSGRLRTTSVVGTYWMSCIRSFSKTTLPGVTATFSPSLNFSRSVILIRSRPWPRSRSSSMFESPCTRFSPPVSTVRRATSGFVIAKLVGARASMNWRV